MSTHLTPPLRAATVFLFRAYFSASQDISAFKVPGFRVPRVDLVPPPEKFGRNARVNARAGGIAPKPAYQPIRYGTWIL